MKRSERAAQARREIDGKFATTNLEAVRTHPRSGWIRAIRGGLGMSQAALAARLGIAAPSVAGLEKSESNETISLGKLAEVARALDCTLVYALVPNTNLEDTVRRQARRVAAETLGYVGHTMALEAQSIESDRAASQLETQTQKVIDSNGLWGIE